jgi:hypothetical protein
MLPIVTHIVAAFEDEAADIAAALDVLDLWSGVEKRGLDTEKFVILHCLLTGEDFDCAAARYEPVSVADEGAVVLRLADDVVERLAALDDEALERVASELAATEMFEVEQWEAGDVAELVMQLAELAMLAESQGQTLFVRMQPITT